MTDLMWGLDLVLCIATAMNRDCQHRSYHLIDSYTIKLKKIDRTSYVSTSVLDKVIGLNHTDGCWNDEGS